MKKSFQEIKSMLDKINEDEEWFVPYSDVEYYTQQLINLELGTEEECLVIARQLAE